LNPGVGFDSKQLSHYPPAFVLLVLVRVIQPFAEITATLALSTEFRVQRVIELACEHFLLFGPHSTHGYNKPWLSKPGCAMGSSVRAFCVQAG
jgi:hypothetical protein